MAVFNLRSSALVPGSQVVGFRGHEGLSRLFEFDVYFTSVDPDLDLQDALTSKATLSIDLGDGLHQYHGILSSMKLLRAVHDNALYVAKLVPQVWQLSQTRHSRMWTKTSIKDAITEVLTESSLSEGTDFEFQLASAPSVEEHICQYKESNLSFVQRWLDREGWYYFFDHTDGSDKLVITDTKTSHKSLTMKSVRYWPTGRDHSSAHSFEDFTCTHVALPAQVRVVDYDYAKPMLDVSHTAVVSKTGSGDIAEYGARLFSPGEAQRVARLRSEDYQAREVVYHASGAAMHLTSGFTFLLDHHPRQKLNQPYLVTELHHFGNQPSMSKAWGQLVPNEYAEDVYRVEVTAIEATRQFRNGLVTPWPRIDGFENAVVDGATRSQYAQIDSAGRYAVKFKFDEGSLHGGKSSTWVRMSQPHGGSVEGFHFPLRKGTEVICAFLGGDPDRPIITAVVPNSVTPSPVVAANHTQNIIQTGSENYITLEDNAGSQFINVFCPTTAAGLYLGVGRPIGGRGLTTNQAPLVPTAGPGGIQMGAFSFDLRTEANGQVSTVGDLNINADARLQVTSGPQTHIYYGGTLDRDVQGATDEHFHDTMKYEVNGTADVDYGSTLDLDVQAAAKEHYHATLNYTVDGTSDLTLTGASTYIYGAKRDTTVNGFTDDKYKASHSIVVTGDQTQHVTANQKVNVDGNRNDTVTGNLTFTVTGNRAHLTTGNQTHTIIGNHMTTTLGSTSWLKTGASAEVTLAAKATAQLAAHAELNIGAKVAVHVALECTIAAAVKLSLFAFEASFKGVTSQQAGSKLNALGSKMETLGLRFMGHGADVSFGGLTLKA